MPRYSQVVKVLTWFKKHKSITSEQALRKLSIARLGARMWDLRRLGYTHDTETIAVKNTDGETCHVARYSNLKG